MNAGRERSDPGAGRSVVPVGELARSIAGFLERSFPAVWAAGEISNLTRAASGHWYFSLKDRDAQLRCVMFRSRAQAVDWSPREGDHVEARVVPGLYVPRGDFQLQVEQMRRSGAGALYEEYLRIKARLEAAGLFDAGRKRPLPAHPRAIGIVTSAQAAALRDVLATLRRRAPHVEIVVFPTPVQGADAPLRIVEAIAGAARWIESHRIDVLLLVRGGGSIEDLWAFNDERVAQAIAAALVPVVSGVGHETDVTIADFVADLRAPTPTAAAELASPDAAALRMRVAQRQARLARAMERRLDQAGQRVDDAIRRLRSPSQRLVDAQARLDALVRRMMRSATSTWTTGQRSWLHLSARLGQVRPSLARWSERTAAERDRLRRAMARRVDRAGQATSNLSSRLALLDPHGVLARGYAIVSDADGCIVRDATATSAGALLRIELARGALGVRVERAAEGPERDR